MNGANISTICFITISILRNVMLIYMVPTNFTDFTDPVQPLDIFYNFVNYSIYFLYNSLYITMKKMYSKQFILLSSTCNTVKCVYA